MYLLCELYVLVDANGCTVATVRPLQEEKRWGVSELLSLFCTTFLINVVKVFGICTYLKPVVWVSRGMLPVKYFFSNKSVCVNYISIVPGGALVSALGS